MRDIIKKEIEGAIKKVYPERNQGIDFNVSADGKFGDYSSNVAMVIGGNPRENAEKIKSHLEQVSNFQFLISKIEIAGQGFLNFTLSERRLAEGLKNLGHSVSKRTPSVHKKKIQVEFISANPTGELHIGHGRSAFYGDALANVLMAAGYKVEREYFINDSKESAQIKELGKTVLGKGVFYLTDYLKAKIQDSRFKIQVEDEVEAGYLMAQQIQKDNQKFIEKDLKIKFDKWFSEEKELREKTFFKKTLDLLKKKSLVYEKDGAVWLKTPAFSDDEDRVLLRSDGSVSYFLSDIAYHVDKNRRGYNKMIDIWGADHHGHVKRMMAVKKMLGWKGDLEILISQMVILKEGDEKKKLSKRKGIIILLKDLIKEIGLDACRWFYLEKSLSTHMEFDMALAKERSIKNPVYYVQYAGARMSSILSKSKISAKGGSASGGNFQFPKSVRNLVVKLIQFPEIIEDTAKDYQVNRLTIYAYELAKEFSQFYESTKVIGSENEKELIALVALTRKTLVDVLNLLGISAPKKM